MERVSGDSDWPGCRSDNGGVDSCNDAAHVSCTFRCRLTFCATEGSCCSLSSSSLSLHKAMDVVGERAANRADTKAGGSMPEKPSCHLLDLPLEIRVEIYQHLFRSAQLSIQPTWPSIPHCRFSICSCWFPWHIINTCRLLREEALEYLLAATTLQIASLPSKAKLLPHAFSSAIPRTIVMNVESYSKSPLDLETFRSLRTLELHNIAVWCQYHDEEYLCAEGGEVVMYDLAMFNLKRNSLHLHQLCNTRDRAFNILLYCRYVVSSVKHETLVSGDCHLMCIVLTRLGCCD